MYGNWLKSTKTKNAENAMPGSKAVDAKHSVSTEMT